MVDKKSHAKPDATELTFPTEFTIKVFGLQNSDFEKSVLTIIRTHIFDLKENAITQRTSKENKYLALTITINVPSREVLDAIYQDLTKDPHVLMAL